MSGALVLVLRVLLAVALYGFIFWALWTLWKELQIQTHAMAASKIPVLQIYPLDFSASKAARFELSEVILGRDPTCSFVVADDTVSARHTRFSFHKSQWWVEDLQSTNGTYLNDEPINTFTVIVTGDEIRCGQVAFRIEIGKN